MYFIADLLRSRVRHGDEREPPEIDTTPVTAAASPRRRRMTEAVVATDAHEGPVYVADEHALYVTTSRPDVAIQRLALASGELATLCPVTAAANGMTLGPDGRLLVCQQGSFSEPAAIVAVDRATAAVEAVVDSWHGLPLNSPNDVVVASDGGIWFTDPSYGYLQDVRPRPVLTDRVCRLDP
jgi:gluconolactonase